MYELHDFHRSSAAYRVRIALALKGIDYQQRPVDLLAGEQHDMEFRSLNPQGLVPVYGDENLHLVERFTLTKDGHMLYNFTVNDPTAWTEPWSGEYVWKREGEGSEKVYEYACHEGNYAMGNILRGARLLETEELERRAKTDDR